MREAPATVEPPITPEPLTTEDALLGGRVRLVQPRRGYRAAIDPVLLAAAVGAAPGETVLDAGCGTGAAALCLAARLPGVEVVGLERDPALADLARAGIARSGLAGRVRVVAGDLLAPPAELRRQVFTWVMSNPPFLDAAQARLPDEPGRRAARVESCPPAAWIAACLARLAPGGRLVLVHRADRLADLLAALAGRAGEIAVLPVWPRPGTAAVRVLVRARKASRAPGRLLPGLVLHHPDGRFTEAAGAVLRGGEPIPW